MQEIKLVNDRQFTFDGGDDFYPLWSPDGSKLLFLRAVPSLEEWNASLWISDLKGKLIGPMMGTVLTDVGWSPDSTKIAYSSLKVRYSVRYSWNYFWDELHIFDTSTSEDKVILTTGKNETISYRLLAPTRSLDWLPRGGGIVFTHFSMFRPQLPFFAKSQINIISEDGKYLKTLVERDVRTDLSIISDLFVSSSGDIIGFSEIRFSELPLQPYSESINRLWLMNVDGSNQQLILELPSHPGLFSPIKSISFLDESKILIERWNIRLLEEPPGRMDFEKFEIGIIDISTKKFTSLLTFSLETVPFSFIGISRKQPSFNNKFLYANITTTGDYSVEYSIWLFDVKDHTKKVLLSKPFKREWLEKWSFLVLLFLFHGVSVSPTGERIAYLYPDGEGEHMKIWVAEVEGLAPKVTRLNVEVVDPSPPDGARRSPPITFRARVTSDGQPVRDAFVTFYMGDGGTSYIGQSNIRTDANGYAEVRDWDPKWDHEVTFRWWAEAWKEGYESGISEKRSLIYVPASKLDITDIASGPFGVIIFKVKNQATKTVKINSYEIYVNDKKTGWNDNVSEELPKGEEYLFVTPFSFSSLTEVTKVKVIVNYNGKDSWLEESWSERDVEERLLKARDYLKNLGVRDIPEDIPKISYPANVKQPYYDYGTDTIYVPVNYTQSDFVILHEYGHFIEDKWYLFNMPDDWEGDCQRIGKKNAMKEGWAHFLASLARNSPKILEAQPVGINMDFEDPFSNTIFCAHTMDKRQENEACVVSVAGIFWDLYDPANEEFDQLQISPEELVSLIKESMKWNSEGFKTFYINFNAKYRGTDLPEKLDKLLLEGYGISYINLKTEFLVASLHSPANLHAYDSEGKHVGVNERGEIEIEIPNSYYTGPDAEPEEIIIFGQSEGITFKIEGIAEGNFSLLIEQKKDNYIKRVEYRNIFITNSTYAIVEIGLSNPEYVMSLDYDKDGIIDEKKVPNVTEGTLPSETVGPFLLLECFYVFLTIATIIIAAFLILKFRKKTKIKSDKNRVNEFKFILLRTY